MKTKVFVSKEHITGSRCGDTHRCAMASAIRDVVKPGTRISVMYASADLATKSIYRAQTRIKIPQSGGRFITRFDKCKTRDAKQKLKPFTITLDIPEEFLLDVPERFL